MLAAFDGSEDDASEESFEESDAAVESSAELEFSGFVKLEHTVSTRRDQDLSDAFKKNELRNFFKLRYGTDNLFFYTASNQYVQLSLSDEDHEYSEASEVTRNLSYSSSRAEISFRELYNLTPWWLF